MVTIKQIAEMAGVSTATVSNVLHGKTKRVSSANVEKIQRLIDELGYVQPSNRRVLSRSSARLIAVVINYHKKYEEAILSDPFYGKAIGFIEQHLRAHGYYMMFYSAADMDDIFRMVMTWDVDGVITLTFPRSDCEKLFNMIHKPVVSIDAHGELPVQQHVTNVGLDDRMGGRLMAQHLLRRGYEDIYVCTTRDYGNDHSRWLGAKQAWDAGLYPHSRLQLIEAGISQQEREDFYYALTERLHQRRRTAVFFVSDYMAIEAISYLTARGVRIPEQIGIAGYDDILYASRFIIPRLTTIHQDIQRKAERAVDEMISVLNDPAYTVKNVVLPVELVERKST